MENFSVRPDNDMKPTVAEKEGQPRPASIGCFSAFMSASDLAIAYERLDLCSVHAKSIANDRRIDLNFAIHEFDCCHHLFQS